MVTPGESGYRDGLLDAVIAVAKRQAVVIENIRAAVIMEDRAAVFDLCAQLCGVAIHKKGSS